MKQEIQYSLGTVSATAFGGNASSASKLANARQIALTGFVTGSANFDGSGNISIATTQAQNIIRHGTSAPAASLGNNGDLYVLLES